VRAPDAAQHGAQRSGAPLIRGRIKLGIPDGAALPRASTSWFFQ